MTLDELNALPDEDALAAFTRCCGAAAWARSMVAGRPYADAAALCQAADVHWQSTGPDDWHEAFTHHPRIGSVAGLREKFATTASWAAHEQGGTALAADQTLEDLAAGNRAYEEKFGHIFIVCATGKSAAEMLALLRGRLPNEPAAELAIAAAEQHKITGLRLRKLIDA